jgi:AraC-like DNA-binding protein
MEYLEHAPSAALAPVVQCIWTLSGVASDADAALQPVIPDGRPELILHLGDPFERLQADGTVDRQARLLFAGQLTRSLLLRPTGRIAVVGVRLHAYGAAALLAAPQHELADRTPGLDAVSPVLYQDLNEIREATALPEAARLIEERLARRIDLSRVDARVRQAVADIHRHRGRVLVERLAARAGVTRRHLERRFQQHVGMSPKRLARITRLQHALQILERSDASAKGAATAAECGYADQAHFVRECQALSGQPPGAHLLARAELTRFFMASGA